MDGRRFLRASRPYAPAVGRGPDGRRALSWRSRRARRSGADRVPPRRLAGRAVARPLPDKSAQMTHRKRTGGRIHTFCVGRLARQDVRNAMMVEFDAYTGPAGGWSSVKASQPAHDIGGAARALPCRSAGSCWTASPTLMRSSAMDRMSAVTALGCCTTGMRRAALRWSRLIGVGLLAAVCLSSELSTVCPAEWFQWNRSTDRGSICGVRSCVSGNDRVRRYLPDRLRSVLRGA